MHYYEDVYHARVPNLARHRGWTAFIAHDSHRDPRGGTRLSLSAPTPKTSPCPKTPHLQPLFGAELSQSNATSRESKPHSPQSA
jgi:hypothetical protein